MSIFINDSMSNMYIAKKVAIERNHDRLTVSLLLMITWLSADE